jgi:hypothetical protein
MTQDPEDDEFAGADPATLRQYLARLDLSLQAVRRRLKRYEEEFGMDSDEFYARLQNAELDERIEFAEWAGEREMLKRLEAQRADVQARLEAE